MRKPWSDWPQTAVLLIFALALGYLAWLGWGMLPGHGPEQRTGFDGERALALVKDQCELGPRPVGSPQAWMAGDLILAELERAGWKTAVEEYAVGDKQLRNVAGLAGDLGPLLVLAAHYDTPREHDGDKLSPGANGDASGVAVLLELARAVDTSRLQHRVWLVFLDGEADPAADDWAQLSGARRFVKNRHPAAIIYLDMVGAHNARFPQLPDANDLLQTQLWKQAAHLGYSSYFPTTLGPTLQDAHTVFVQAGIPTVEIIQPDYPYARTPEDDCDKLSAQTLAAVGVLLESYLENGDMLTIVPSLR